MEEDMVVRDMICRYEAIYLVLRCGILDILKKTASPSPAILFCFHAPFDFASIFREVQISKAFIVTLAHTV